MTSAELHEPPSKREAPSVDALDASRRTRNTRWIADAFLAIVVLLGGFGALRGEPPTVLVVVVACFATYAGCSVLARRGHAPLAAAILVAMPVLSSVATVLADHRLGPSPFFLAVPLLVAAATMRARGVLLVLGVSLLGLGAMAAGEGLVATETDTQGRILASSGAIVLVTAAIAALIAAGMRAALAESVERERRAQAAETRAIESEERYRLVTDNTGDLIAMVDAAGRYVYASPSHERILGVVPEALLGQTGEAFMHPEEREAVAKLWSEAFEKGRAVGRMRLRGKGGTWVHLDTVLNAVEHEGGRYAIVTAHDVTEQKQLGEQLQRAQRMESLGRLAGGVAHDFNNLLVVIQSGAELARTELAPGHAAKQDLDDVLKATSRAAALTKQLLAFSRRQVIPAVRVDVNVALVDALGLAAHLVPDSVRIERDLQENLWPVTCGSAQIEQVVLNLAANARDAMPGGGTLRVVARNFTVEDGAPEKRGSYVQLMVTDTGAGIPEDVRSRVFEPFFTTKSPGFGTGLGLATCYGIVEQLGGTITVDSEVGVGTTFTVLLPRATASATSVAPPPRAAAVLGGQGVVLVVDDDPQVRELMRRVVVARGRKAVCADGEESGLARARELEGQLELVVSDIMLGAGDGLRMVEAIRSERPGIAVILTSGYARDPEAINRAVGADVAFLPKPFAPSDLSRSIDAAFARPAAVASP